MLNFMIDDIIKTALAEDIHYIDITTEYLLPVGVVGNAEIIAKVQGVVAGVDIAARVFELLDPGMKIEKLKQDGDRVADKEVIMTLCGSAAALLQSERTALNIIQHLSGIATQTRKCVDAVTGTKAVITETRKTLPGLRGLQKYAVTAGGGKNHRYNLSDAVMLKDNHIDICGGITKAMERLREKLGHMVKIEVEVRDFDELNEALQANADVIMLDNMTVSDMAQAVKITNGRAVLEASGNITSENIAEIAKTGVDVISLGSLTHSVTALDMSLLIDIKAE